MIFVRVVFFLLAIFVESEREISANSCFSVADTIQGLNACFEKGFPGDNTLSDAQWERMLPDEEEMKNYQALIKTVLRGGRGRFCNNKVLALYPSISNYIDLQHFQGHFCVIYERNVDPETGYFLRSWGYVVVADDVWSRRDLHHSAPHFQSDGNVLNESAAIFERTQSRTLVMAGASRYAVKGSKSTCQSEYSATDCAHNNNTMFHAVNAAIFEYQANCNHKSCAFIQWHGMAETTCPICSAFVSAGVSNHTAIYEDSRIPAVKLAAAFDGIEGVGRACTPLESACKLVASTNVFGRLVNGVAREDVCTRRSVGASGAFVHVEQRRAARDQWDRWARAIKSAFPVRPSHVPRPAERRHLSAPSNRP
uniref:Uncharacterized protein n=1 Tax=Plectus sambesii TaxID=2011161 RepID=A0A914UW75_9BILA